jgi:hypothetical protein
MPQIFESRSVCARAGGWVGGWVSRINPVYPILCEIDVELSRSDLKTLI